MSAFEIEDLAKVYPLPFLLREAVKDSWFRFHSLPESKRYPESEADWSILMARHRKVSDIVLGRESLCRVFYAVFDESSFPLHDPELSWVGHSVIEVEEELPMYISTTDIYWDFDSYSEWIRCRSVDELGWTIFHSSVTDSVYAPYDGGADIFSMDSDCIDSIRSKFARWKSAHPEGL